MFIRIHRFEEDKKKGFAVYFTRNLYILMFTICLVRLLIEPGHFWILGFLIGFSLVSILLTKKPQLVFMWPSRRKS